MRPPKVPKTHDANSNSFVENRKRRRLCDAFNTGACVFKPQNAACPNDGTLVHQCSRCLQRGHAGSVMFLCLILSWRQGCAELRGRS